MATKQPNIILITSDQQRFDTIGPAKPSFLRTPHLDNLMREGVTFTSAYSDCPICVAARVSIMTGKYVRTHGCTTNWETSRFIGRDNTLPSLLRDQGYQTAAIGKMHFGPERARHGFDEMILPADYYLEMARSGNPVQPMRHGLGQNELYPGMATVPEAMTLTSWTAEKSLQYIKERRDPTAPFFLWCSFSKPHPPLDPPEPYYSMYRNCAIPEPVLSQWSATACPPVMRRQRETQSYDVIPPEIIREARAAYYGLITQIDYNIGRVLAALQDIGNEMYNETLILFTSDHGEFLGDHRTGSKTFFHDPSARIPFILRLPRSWRSGGSIGTTCARLVTHADIVPTLLSATGGETPQDCDGQSLLGLLDGTLNSPRSYLEAFGGHPNLENSLYLGITDGTWKYIWYPEGGVEQLFNLERDPHEQDDLASKPQYASERQRLRGEIIARERARGGVFLDSTGQLAAVPVKTDTEQMRRANSWPGFHSEHHPVDVRH